MRWLYIAVLIILVAGGVVSAGVPDPVYQVWPTLTPIPSPNATSYEVGQIGPAISTAVVDIAETTVQGYQLLNSQTNNALRLLWTGVLIMIVVAGLWLILAKVQQL